MFAARKLLLCLALAVSLGTGFAQTTWDPTASFSVSNGNPNGVWTYGWMDTGFGAFTPYTTATANAWQGWGGDGTPTIWINQGATTSFGVPAGYLSIHPGPGTEPSVLRWTSPVTGLVAMSGQFLAGDSGVMQVAIFQNTKTNTLWSATDAGTFNFNVNVTAGDTLNFTVFGGYGFGNTPLQLSLTAVPEPAAGGLVALGMLVLAATRASARRRPA